MKHKRAFIGAREGSIKTQQSQEGSDSEVEADNNEEPFNEHTAEGYCLIHLGLVFVHQYVVVKKLGHGAFSTVWLCRDVVNQRFVAIKVIKQEFREDALEEINLLRAADL